MAANGRPFPTSFDAARLNAWHPEPALRTHNPSSGPEVRAGLPAKTPPISIASAPADGHATAIRMKRRQGAHQDAELCEHDTDCHRVRTCLTPSSARLGNRKRMAIAKSSSRPIANFHLGDKA